MCVCVCVCVCVCHSVSKGSERERKRERDTEKYVVRVCGSCFAHCSALYWALVSEWAKCLFIKFFRNLLISWLLFRGHPAQCAYNQISSHKICPNSSIY
jgi:hypothetical protein